MGFQLLHAQIDRARRKSRPFRLPLLLPFPCPPPPPQPTRRQALPSHARSDQGRIKHCSGEEAWSQIGAPWVSHRASQGKSGAMVCARQLYLNTRTGGGSENHTVSRGAYLIPPSISAPMRAAETNFDGCLGPHYKFFWPKFWHRGSTPSWLKRVEFPKCWPFLQKRTVFRFFRASSVTIIARKNMKKTFQSSWNVLSLICHQILAKVNSLGYTGHQSWKKNEFVKQNSFP